MTIRKRLFLYSFGVVGIVAFLILLYFTLMLSQLYAKQIEMDRVNTLKAIQTVQLSGDDKAISQSLNQFETPNSIGSLTLAKDSSKVLLNLAYSTIEIDVVEPELQALLAEVYALVSEMEELSETEGQKKLEKLAKKAERLLREKEFVQPVKSDLIKIKAKDRSRNYQEEFNVEGVANFHQVTEEQFIVETKVSDHSNMYTTYLGLTKEQGKIHLLVAAAMTPKMTQLNQVIYSSLPMIIVVLLVIISVATVLLSSILIKPLAKVSHQMSQMKAGSYVLEAAEPEAVKDEYQQLEADLVALYATLAEQKAQLAKQNRRQGVFLKASSHQLKTPVTAALLLVEGMIGEVGKYRDTKIYLPEVKEKLRWMEKIINDILLIDQRIKEEPQIQLVNVDEMVQGLLNKQELLMKARSLELNYQVEPELKIHTDPSYFEQIIENLLSNACHYTAEGERLSIYTADNQLLIENSGAQLASEWQEKLFEPFVRPPQATAGHGLGLYLVAQYAELLGMEVTLENSPNNSVIATIYFP